MKKNIRTVYNLEHFLYICYWQSLQIFVKEGNPLYICTTIKLFQCIIYITYILYIVYSVCIHTQQNIIMENCVLLFVLFLFGLDDKITKNTNKIGLKYFSQKI